MFLFFKQKTAYEMRISDWSSDVFSSDLISPYVNELRSSVSTNGADDSACIAQAAKLWCSSFCFISIHRQEPPSHRWRRGYVQVNRACPWIRSLRRFRHRHQDRKSTRLNSSHSCASRMTSSA